VSLFFASFARFPVWVFYCSGLVLLRSFNGVRYIDVSIGLVSNICDPCGCLSVLCVVIGILCVVGFACASLCVSAPGYLVSGPVYVHMWSGCLL
jgi:hypothetical protein